MSSASLKRGLVCAFYRDGTVSCGSQPVGFNGVPLCQPVSNLAATRSSYSYSTAPGQSPSTIVAMGGDDDNSHIYAWYADGRVSSGSTDDLDRYRPLYGYDLAGGYSPSMVAEVVSDGSFNCVFYRDGNVTCGTTDN